MADEAPLQTNPSRERAVKISLIRNALLWGPVFLATVGALVFFTYDRITGPEHGGTWFLTGVLAFFSIVFLVPSLGAIRDLRRGPSQISGMVARKWTKRDSFVIKSWYIRVGRNIYRGDQEMLGAIAAGDIVTMRLYQHSGVILAIRKEEPLVPDEPAEDEPPQRPGEPVQPRSRAVRPEF
ncbi:MAG: hypothetical protein AB7T37_06145 [Dehalococcoidia bacterium]